MSKIVDNKFFKPFVFLLALTVISLSVLPAVSKVSTASASDLEKLVDEADADVGAAILKSLEFNKDKTAFVGFDEEQAKSEGLNEKDFANVSIFFELRGDAFQPFKDAKLSLESKHSTYGISDWAAYLKLAAVIAALTFVGKALITQMTTDLYKLGVTKFCKKRKKYSAIKSACKDLGYIK